MLKVANSAYYGFPQGITDLERAVALLGFNMVNPLVA
jgi:HD-like signal output (HDOD) protein